VVDALVARRHAARRCGNVCVHKIASSRKRFRMPTRLQAAIEVTANLQQPNLLPLFDSDAAGDLF
jgi:hypothetical protein